jgi:hypothetical protein
MSRVLSDPKRANRDSELQRSPVQLLLVLLPFCALFAFPTTAAAQTAASTTAITLLPVDSPQLNHLFVIFHADFSGWLDQQRQGKVSNEQQRLDRDAAASFGLSVADHNALKAVTTLRAAQLRAIDDQERQHMNARANLEVRPIASQMQAFAAARNSIISDAMNDIRSHVTPSGWAALQVYLNGPYRHMHRLITLVHR